MHVQKMADEETAQEGESGKPSTSLYSVERSKSGRSTCKFKVNTMLPRASRLAASYTLSHLAASHHTSLRQTVFPNDIHSANAAL